MAFIYGWFESWVYGIYCSDEGRLDGVEASLLVWRLEFLHMCFKCRATQPRGNAPFTDVSSAALWKQLRYQGTELIKELFDNKKELSPIFSLPGFEVSYIVIDVLHAVDLGVAADVVGLFFL